MYLFNIPIDNNNNKTTTTTTISQNHLYIKHVLNNFTSISKKNLDDLSESMLEQLLEIVLNYRIKQNLGTVNIFLDKDNIVTPCGVCWNDISFTEKSNSYTYSSLKYLPCGHVLCMECINNMNQKYSINQKCPYCRENIRDITNSTKFVFPKTTTLFNDLIIINYDNLESFIVKMKSSLSLRKEFIQFVEYVFENDLVKIIFNDINFINNILSKDLRILIYKYLFLINDLTRFESISSLEELVSSLYNEETKKFYNLSGAKICICNIVLNLLKHNFESCIEYTKKKNNIMKIKNIMKMIKHLSLYKNNNYIILYHNIIYDNKFSNNNYDLIKELNLEIFISNNKFRTLNSIIKNIKMNDSDFIQLISLSPQIFIQNFSHFLKKNIINEIDLPNLNIIFNKTNTINLINLLHYLEQNNENYYQIFKKKNGVLHYQRNFSKNDQFCFLNRFYHFCKNIEDENEDDSNKDENDEDIDVRKREFLEYIQRKYSSITENKLLIFLNYYNIKKYYLDNFIQNSKDIICNHSLENFDNDYKDIISFEHDRFNKLDIILKLVQSIRLILKSRLRYNKYLIDNDVKHNDYVFRQNKIFMNNNFHFNFQSYYNGCISGDVINITDLLENKYLCFGLACQNVVKKSRYLALVVLLDNRIILKLDLNTLSLYDINLKHKYDSIKNCFLYSGHLQYNTTPVTTNDMYVVNYTDLIKLLETTSMVTILPYSYVDNNYLSTPSSFYASFGEYFSIHPTHSNIITMMDIENSSGKGSLNLSIDINSDSCVKCNIIDINIGIKKNNKKNFISIHEIEELYNNFLCFRETKLIKMSFIISIINDNIKDTDTDTHKEIDMNSIISDIFSA